MKNDVFEMRLYTWSSLVGGGSVMDLHYLVSGSGLHVAWCCSGHVRTSHVDVVVSVLSCQRLVAVLCSVEQSPRVSVAHGLQLVESVQQRHCLMSRMVVFAEEQC